MGRSHLTPESSIYSLNLVDNPQNLVTLVYLFEWLN